MSGEKESFFVRVSSYKHEDDHEALDLLLLKEEVQLLMESLLSSQAVLGTLPKDPVLIVHVVDFTLLYCLVTEKSPINEVLRLKVKLEYLSRRLAALSSQRTPSALPNTLASSDEISSNIGAVSTTVQVLISRSNALVPLSQY